MLGRAVRVVSRARVALPARRTAGVAARPSSWARTQSVAVPRRGFHARCRTRAEEDVKVNKDKLALSFGTPYEALYAETPVDMVILPGFTGEFGVTPNHVPTVAQLKPGVVQVHNKDTEPARFFISGGFAIVEEAKCSITVAEAVNVDDLDVDAVNAGVDRYQNEMDKAPDEKSKAEAQIGHEVHTVAKQALEYFKK